MVAGIGWHHGYDSGGDPVGPDYPEERELKQHDLNITRYVDLGPIAAHGVTPKWFAKYRREDMLAVEYDVTPEGHWRYTGRGSAKERFRLGRLLHGGPGDYESRLLEAEISDEPQADRGKMEYRSRITRYSVTSTSVKQVW